MFWTLDPQIIWGKFESYPSGTQDRSDTFFGESSLHSRSTPRPGSGDRVATIGPGLLVQLADGENLPELSCISGSRHGVCDWWRSVKSRRRLWQAEKICGGGGEMRCDDRMVPWIIWIGCGYQPVCRWCIWRGHFGLPRLRHPPFRPGNHFLMEPMCSRQIDVFCSAQQPKTANLVCLAQNHALVVS